MGQQQLILLVLATVIVGVAIVVGIRAFTENSAKSNVDAMIQDAVRIANDAQAWKKKPAPFGGQPEGASKNDPADYSDIDAFSDVGYQPDDSAVLNYSNLNGCFTIAPSATGMTITGVNLNEHNQIEITVDGITDEDINQSAEPVIGDDAVVTTDPCA